MKKMTRFTLAMMIDTLSKPNQFIHEFKGSYRMYDHETKEDYGYITYKDFQKISVTEVNFKDQHKGERFYRF